jgi:hypothetical protein
MTVQPILFEGRMHSNQTIITGPVAEIVKQLGQLLAITRPNPGGELSN